jgi:serine/threonine-protein kinase HipA
MATVKTRVARFGDEAAIVVDRYDRYPDAGRVMRVHQEDLCQALGAPPTKKYQSDGGPTARDIAELLRRAMSTPGADRAVQRFADALIWNWLIGGTDGHAKNYSLLLQGQRSRAGPLVRHRVGAAVRGP